ncbi:hypothetical protein PG991_000105 [Apiospora marii]|uniref:Uncharacterized protein n=1 Tax=Apiospora marii TaxID=335849 RepID=A0ABR1T152_9PEZI
MHFTNAIAAAILAYCAVAAPAGPTCDSSESCIGSCQVTFDRCSTAPDANHADCVSRLVACTGKSVEESLKPQSAVAKRFQTHADSCTYKDDACRTAPGANMSLCNAQKAECKDQCSSDADACRSAPNSNMAQCASGYSKCLGYNPYSKRGDEPHWAVGEPLTQPAPHSETGDAVYFPAPEARDEPHWAVGEPLTQPAPHSEVGEPLTQPAQKLTSSLFQKPESSSGSPARSGSCKLADNSCRTGPGANQAQCSAEKAACSAMCKSDADACRVAPGANQSACSADYAKCLGENPYAKKRGTPTSSSGSAVHQGNCEQLDTDCRTAPDANMAECSAKVANCKATCDTENSACRAVPNANMSTCSAEYAQCLGKNPYN